MKGQAETAPRVPPTRNVPPAAGDSPLSSSSTLLQDHDAEAPHLGRVADGFANALAACSAAVDEALAEEDWGSDDEMARPLAWRHRTNCAGTAVPGHCTAGLPVSRQADDEEASSRFSEAGRGLALTSRSLCRAVARGWRRHVQWQHDKRCVVSYCGTLHRLHVTRRALQAFVQAAATPSTEAAACQTSPAVLPSSSSVARRNSCAYRDTITQTDGSACDETPTAQSVGCGEGEDGLRRRDGETDRALLGDRRSRFGDRMRVMEEARAPDKCRLPPVPAGTVGVKRRKNDGTSRDSMDPEGGGFPSRSTRTHIARSSDADPKQRSAKGLRGSGRSLSRERKMRKETRAETTLVQASEKLDRQAPPKHGRGQAIATPDNQALCKVDATEARLLREIAALDARRKGVGGRQTPTAAPGGGDMTAADPVAGEARDAGNNLKILERRTVSIQDTADSSSSKCARSGKDEAECQLPRDPPPEHCLAAAPRPLADQASDSPPHRPCHDTALVHTTSVQAIFAPVHAALAGLAGEGRDQRAPSLQQDPSEQPHTLGSKNRRLALQLPDALPSDKVKTQVPNPHTLAFNPGPKLYLKVA